MNCFVGHGESHLCAGTGSPALRSMLFDGQVVQDQIWFSTDPISKALTIGGNVKAQILEEHVCLFIFIPILNHANSVLVEL